MNIRRSENLFVNRGQALLELALVLPLLVLLVLGVVDFSRVLLANNIITNMSREGADLASRGNVQGADANASNQYIMTAVGYTAQPLNMPAYGMMYITVIQGVSGGGIQIVAPSPYAWSGTALTGSNKPASRISTPTPSNPNPLFPFTLAAGDTAYVFEVFYRFQSIFPINAAKITPVLYSRAIF